MMSKMGGAGAEVNMVHVHCLFTIYYIKFSGISSGNKSIKMLSTSDDIILSTHVISFLTNQLAVFSHTVKHLRFSVCCCIVRIL